MDRKLIAHFSILDDIANAYDVRNWLWAEKSFGNRKYQSRISELRKIYGLHAKGDNSLMGRRVTIEKIAALTIGLAKIIGGDALNKELTKRLEKLATDRERNLAKILAIDDKKQKKLAALIDLVLNENTE